MSKRKAVIRTYTTPKLTRVDPYSTKLCDYYFNKRIFVCREQLLHICMVHLAAGMYLELVRAKDIWVRFSDRRESRYTIPVQIGHNGLIYIDEVRTVLCLALENKLDSIWRVGETFHASLYYEHKPKRQG